MNVYFHCYSQVQQEKRSVSILLRRRVVIQVRHLFIHTFMYECAYILI